MNYLVYIGLLMYMMGLFVYVSKRNHLLFMLMSLEFMILSVYLLTMLNLLLFISNVHFLLIYLICSVCESVMGLSVLISMIRTHGSDYYFSMNLLC